MLEKIEVSLQLVANPEAKLTLLPTREKVTVRFENKTTLNPPKKKKRLAGEQFQILKTQRARLNSWKVSETNQSKLESVYQKGSAAYGSVTNLQKETKLIQEKLRNFLWRNGAHTKYKQDRRTFSRPKAFAYDVDERWSVDVTYVNKLARYNKGVKYLLVAVNVLCRKLRVLPVQTKTEQETAKGFGKKTPKVKQQKVWSEEGTEVKGAFLRLCRNINLETYTSHSEDKLVSAERNVRSHKNIMHKHLENKWSYQ